MTGVIDTATSTPRIVEDSPLYSPSLFAEGDPWGYLAELRENSPVSIHRRDDGYEFYALTRHQDVYAAYVAHEALSSSYGTMIDGSYRPQEDSASNRMLIVSDSPAHGRIKKPVKRGGFNREMITRIGQIVRRNIRSKLADLRIGDTLDFSRDIAPALPRGVLEVLFGISEDQAGMLLDATRTMIGYRDAAYAGDSPLDALVDAQLDVLEFMDRLLAERAATGSADDLPGALARAVADGEMGHDVALLNALNVAVGGNETTPHTAGLTVEAINHHPEQWAKVTTGAVEAGAATEEFLRWTSTNSYVQRLAVADFPVAGHVIPAGSFVTLWNMAANRDPAVFEYPDRFLVDRPDNRQIAFGAGVHRCIGAPVATLEIRAFIEELAQWDKAFAITGPPQRLRSNFMLGLTSLPVEVVAAADLAGRA